MTDSISANMQSLISGCAMLQHEGGIKKCTLLLNDFRK